MVEKKLNFRFSLNLSIAFMALCLSACADSSQPLSPSFGDSIRQNSEKQVVNPNPDPPTEDAASMDGNKVVLGVQAYKSGTVAKPTPLSTQRATKGGGAAK